MKFRAASLFLTHFCCKRQEKADVSGSYHSPPREGVDRVALQALTGLFNWFLDLQWTISETVTQLCQVSSAEWQALDRVEIAN